MSTFYRYVVFIINEEFGRNYISWLTVISQTLGSVNGEKGFIHILGIPNAKQSGIRGGIITRILASRMQRSLKPRAKFSAEVMQNYANSVKPMRHTRYFERSTCSKGLGCGEVKNFMPPWFCIKFTILK